MCPSADEGVDNVAYIQNGGFGAFIVLLCFKTGSVTYVALAGLELRQQFEGR